MIPAERRPTKSTNLKLEFSFLPQTPLTITVPVADQCGILRAETCCQQTFTEMQIGCVCCPGSQIISQTKTISAFSSMKNVCRQQGAKSRQGNVKQTLVEGRHWQETWRRVSSVKSWHQTHKLKHSEASVQSQDVQTKLKPYLTIDLQESLGMTGNTLLICTP